MNDRVKSFINHLKHQGCRKIYLSHEPWEEEEAREFAEKLREQGIEVVVAADVRSPKDYPHLEAHLEVVRQAIKSCDAVIVYRKNRRNPRCLLADVSKSSLGEENGEDS